MIEIIFGTYRLYPKTKYLPLRLHLLGLLTNLSKETGVYIPVIPELLKLLKLNIFTRKIKKFNSKNKKPFEIQISVKLGKQDET